MPFCLIKYSISFELVRIVLNKSIAVIPISELPKFKGQHTKFQKKVKGGMSAKKLADNRI